MTAVAKGSGKRKAKDADLMLSKNSTKEKEVIGDLDLSSDIKGILSALHQIKEKAQKDGQKKSEETIGTVASEITSMLNDAKTKFEKERQNLIKTITKISKEYEVSLKNEIVKFQAAHEKYCKDKATHMQGLEEIFSNFEMEKEKTFARYEQQRKKEKATISELEKACADKITTAEDSLKKNKQDDKSFSILRKSLGSFLDGASDDDFASDE